MVVLSFSFFAGMAGAAEPEWLQELRARESKPATTTHEVKSADGWFGARVQATPVGKVEEEGGSYSFSFELAPEIFVNCELVRDGFDLASLLSSTAASSFEFLGREQGKITQRSVERTDAGHIAGSPYLAVDWIYLVDTDEGPKVGSLKQLASVKDGHGVYCALNDVGFARSFESLARSFIETLQVKAAPAPGLYDDISVVTLGTAKVGVATSSVERDADGDLRVQTSTAMLVPVAADKLRVQDSFSVQFVRPDGTMINALHVIASDGEVESDLKLEPAEGGGWHVSGQHKGKSLDGRLDSAHEPTTFLQQAMVRKALLAKPEPANGENVEWQWIASDPLRLTESRLKIVGPAAEGFYQARESAGPLQADTVLERATGMTQRFDAAIGPQTMTVERVYSRGSL
jgi:hypothetical protein